MSGAMDAKRTDFLARIVADKAEEVIATQLARPYEEVAAAARAAPPPRDFAGAILARLSGTRDHGATSTTVQTEPEPVLARTCRSPSRRRERSSAPAARSSS